MVYPCGIICGWLLLDTYCSATKHKMKFVIVMAVSIAFMAALTMIIYWPVLVVSGSQEVLGNYYTISHVQFFQGLFPYVRTLAGIWFQEWPQIIVWGVLVCAISRILIASVLGRPNESILLVTLVCGWAVTRATGTWLSAPLVIYSADSSGRGGSRIHGVGGLRYSTAVQVSD